MLVDGLLCLFLMRPTSLPYRGSTIMAAFMLHTEMISRLTVTARTAIDTSRQQAGLLSSNGHLRYLRLILLGACCSVPRLTSSNLSVRTWLEARAQ
jgi:hypothetical protein